MTEREKILAGEVYDACDPGLLEELVHSDLLQYLLSVNEIDERLPECPDVEDRWETIANAYIPDGVREFQNYPLASLGWMMYIGMAVAKMWDDNWQYYAAKEDLYVYLRDKRGYDAMDEYIRRDFLKLPAKDFAATEELISECASRVHNCLMRHSIEPGTKEAFLGYVACLHQLYLFGIAVQLKRMGYHMTRI